MRRLARFGLVVATVVALGGMTASASADDNRPRVIDANLAALPASMTSQTLFGVTAGGAPWRLDGGRVRLFSDGRLEVTVRHLVLVPTGQNPIGSAVAIVTCQGTPLPATQPVAFSTPDGNASIDTSVALPSGGCFAPAVFFAGLVPNVGPRWFAVTGTEG
jgi:hypothetical protein